MYGLLLLGKMAAFGVLLLLAIWNRWRVVPAMASQETQEAAADGATQTLRRTITFEYLLLVAVLATTAVLTTFYGPRP